MIRLLLTSGRGPAECRIALAGIAGRLVAEAQALGLVVDRVDGPAHDEHGPASLVLVLDGAAGEALAARWVGSVQWTAPSPLRPHHGRKNWFVAVVRLPGAAATPPPLRPQDVCVETMRAGGAGGQHQNKTESAVRAVHRPTGLAVAVRSERSQHRNKAEALERLAGLLAARAELAAHADRQQTQAAHDSLERGRPVRRFKGPQFQAV